MTGSLGAVGLAGGRIGALATASDPQQPLPAREQMAFTLGFHIVLVPFGVTFTILMLIAEGRWPFRMCVAVLARAAGARDTPPQTTTDPREGRIRGIAPNSRAGADLAGVQARRAANLATADLSARGRPGRAWSCRRGLQCERAVRRR